MSDEAELSADAETATPDEAVPQEVEADEPTPDEVLTWAGYKLDEMNGSGIGKVEGVFVDDSTAKPEWLLARMGRFGHYCLVPVRDAVGAHGHVWVPYTRDQIRRAPRAEPKKSITRDAEQGLLDYYGIGTGAHGRSADIAERGAETITLRPT